MEPLSSDWRSRFWVQCSKLLNVFISLWEVVGKTEVLYGFSSTLTVLPGEHSIVWGHKFEIILKIVHLCLTELFFNIGTRPIFLKWKFQSNYTLTMVTTTAWLFCFMTTAHHYNKIDLGKTVSDCCSNICFGWKWSHSLKQPIRMFKFWDGTQRL